VVVLFTGDAVKKHRRRKSHTEEQAEHAKLNWTPEVCCNVGPEQQISEAGKGFSLLA
jgi:hypothetical protein